MKINRAVKRRAKFKRKQQDDADLILLRPSPFNAEEYRKKREADKKASEAREPEKGVFAGLKPKPKVVHEKQVQPEWIGGLSRGKEQARIYQLKRRELRRNNV